MKKIGIFIIALGIFFVGAGKILAQNAAPAEGGISLTPFLKELELAEGQREGTFPLEIKNDSSSPVNIDFSVADFGSAGETGGALIMDGQKNVANQYGLASYIELEKGKIALAAGEKKSVQVKIINGHSLSPGGHYGAVVADIENIFDGKDGSASNVKLNSKMTALIFLRKIGGEKYDLALREEETDASFLSLPKKNRLYFENKGNVHVTARGLVSIVDPLGREIERGIINNESGIVLPGSVRMFPINFVQNKIAFLPGEYKIITKYRYDGKSEFVVQEKMFLHSPLISNGFLCVILFLLTYGLVGWLIGNKRIASGLMKIKIRLKTASISMKKRYGDIWRFAELSKKNKRINREAGTATRREIALKMEEKKRNGIKTRPKTKASVSRTSGRQLGKAKFLKYIFIIVLIATGAMLFYFYDILFQRPVSGEIRTEPNRIGRTENSPMERFEAVHLSFRHSPTYQINFQEKGIVENKNILERALLSQRESGNRRIALTVEDMNNRYLTDVANYNLRQKKTSMYKESKFVSGDLSGIAFVSREEGLFEKTVFISREQKLIEISFSGPLNSENELEMEMRDTLESIQWKK